MAVGFVNDHHRLGVALLVVVSDGKSSILAAVVDDDNFELVEHLINQHGVHTTAEVLLHVVTRDADTQ